VANVSHSGRQSTAAIAGKSPLNFANRSITEVALFTPKFAGTDTLNPEARNFRMAVTTAQILVLESCNDDAAGRVRLPALRQ